MYKFTIFTATYNRAITLVQVYESLCKQTFKDFEWLIVDDGSSDNTSDIVTNFIKEEKIAIHYYPKLNGGKHTAFNLGVSKSQGELFLTLDSDDRLTSNSLEIFNQTWDGIPDKDSFVSVCGLCSDFKGQLIGSKFPISPMDCTSIEIRDVYHVQGDKTAFSRTDILRQFPFPVIENEKYMTEAIVFDKISMLYKTRFINEILCEVDYQENGLSRSSLKLRVQNINGTLMYYNQATSLYKSLKKKIRYASNYVRFSLHHRDSMITFVKRADHPILVLFSFILGYFMYLKDRGELNEL